MGTFTYSATADLPAEEAFAMISDAPNLARLLPQRVDEGWLRTDAARKQIAWGTEGGGDDSGALRVVDRGPAQCEIAIELHTDRTDEDRVRKEMEEAIAALAHQASADADGQQEDKQEGWV